MEADFWHSRWDSGHTPWDQAHAHPALDEHWHEAVAHSAAVFVPLCGKSVDMDWFASHGHRVVGSELSRAGVVEFFADRGLVPDVGAVGPFEIHSAAPFELWCGDFFDLPAEALDGIRAVYDRASLVALPVDMRRRYAEHLTIVTPSEAVVVVLSFEYDESEMQGPPFSVTRDEIIDLYGGDFDIDVVAVDETLARNADLAARGLSRVAETVTVLRR